jgi:hypothetical protein
MRDKGEAFTRSAAPSLVGSAFQNPSLRRRALETRIDECQQLGIHAVLESRAHSVSLILWKAGSK